MKSIAIAIVVVTALLTAVAQIPASVFIPENHYVSKNRIAIIQAVRGSIWKGQVLLSDRSQKNEFLIDWDVNAACLLLLDFCVQVDGRTFKKSDSNVELSAKIEVPLASSLFSNGCSSISSLEINNLNGIITPGIVQMFIPELLAGEQSLKLTGLSFELDLEDGVLSDAEGEISVGSGAVQYRALNGSVMRQNMVGLEGRFEDVEGLQLVLRDERQVSYIAFKTDETGENFDFIVYDAFAQLFGAPPIQGQSGNNPRFEISQKINDMICGPA